MTRRQFVTTVLVTSLLALLSGPRASAGIEPQPFMTGLFGIAVGQAIRVSVLNTGVERGIIEPCVSPEPLVAAVVVRDLRGAPLFETPTEKLLAGMGTVVDFVPSIKATSSTTLRTPSPGQRLQLRAEVAFSEEDLVRVQCSGVALTPRSLRHRHRPDRVHDAVRRGDVQSAARAARTRGPVKAASGAESLREGSVAMCRTHRMSEIFRFVVRTFVAPVLIVKGP